MTSAYKLQFRSTPLQKCVLFPVGDPLPRAPISLHVLLESKPLICLCCSCSFALAVPISQCQAMGHGSPSFEVFPSFGWGVTPLWCFGMSCLGVTSSSAQDTLLDSAQGATYSVRIQIGGPSQLYTRQEPSPLYSLSSCFILCLLWLPSMTSCVADFVTFRGCVL